MQFWCPSWFLILRVIHTHFILWRKTKKLILWPLLTITTFLTYIQTYMQTDTATLWPNRPRGPSRWEEIGLRSGSYLLVIFLHTKRFAVLELLSVNKAESNPPKQIFAKFLNCHWQTSNYLWSNTLTSFPLAGKNNKQK